MNNSAVLVLERLKRTYLSLLAVYAILREVVPLGFIVGSGLLAYLFFGMGFALIGADLLVNRLSSHGKTSFILLAFLAICGLSTLVNYKYEFVSNVKAICWMVLFFMLAYPQGKQMMLGSEKTVSGMFYSAVITFTVLSLVSLPMYFFDVDYVYTNFNEMGVRSSQGFSDCYMRLWGVFQDANRAATYGFVAILMAMYLFFTERRKPVKSLLVVCVFFIFLYIVLTLSRTTRLIVLMVCCWSALAFVYAKSTRRLGIKILLSAGAALAAVLVCYCVFSATISVLPQVKASVKKGTSQELNAYVHKIYDAWYQASGICMLEGYWVDPEGNTPDEDAEEVTSTEETQPMDETQPPQVEELERTDGQTNDISNGRFERWKDGVLIFLKAPVIGASPRGVNAFAKDYCPDTYAAQYNRNIHNSFLEVLAGTGVLGCSVIIVLLVLTVYNILKAVFTQGFSGKMLLFSNTLLALVIFGILTSDLFFVLTFGSIMFWIALGAVNEGKV